MARIRSIKPGFFLNEEVAALSFEWRLLFVGIWTQADRAGRLEDRPMRLKAAIFPYDNLDIETGLTKLAGAGLILRYQVGDKRLIAVPTWNKHQQPHVREAESEYPSPEHGASTVLASGQHTRSGSGKGADPDPDPEVSSALPSAPHEPAAPPVLTFPIIGKGGPTWALTKPDIAEWTELFPGLDVLVECRKALAWVKSNDGHRKTASGMRRFLVAWFTRTVNRGGSVRAIPTRPHVTTGEAWACPHTPPCHSRQWCQTGVRDERDRQKAQAS